MSSDTFGAADQRGWEVTSASARSLARSTVGWDGPVAVIPGAPRPGRMPVTVAGGAVTVCGAVFAPLGRALFAPLDQWRTRFSMPALTGAVIVGAVWAANDHHWPPATAQSRVADVTRLWGQIRAEGLYLQRRPADAAPVTAGLLDCALQLFTGGWDASEQATAAVLAADQVLSRVMVGTLPATLGTSVVHLLGAAGRHDILGQLAVVAQQAMAAPTGDVEGLQHVARQWVRLVDRLVAVLDQPPGRGSDQRPDGGQHGTEPDDPGEDGDADGEDGVDEAGESGNHSTNSQDDEEVQRDADGTTTSEANQGTDPAGEAGNSSQHPADIEHEDTPGQGNSQAHENGGLTDHSDPWQDTTASTSNWPNPDPGEPCPLSEQITAALRTSHDNAVGEAEHYERSLTVEADPQNTAAENADNAASMVFPLDPAAVAATHIRHIQPTPIHRAYADRIRRQLTSASYVTPTPMYAPASTPPRRMNSSRLMQRHAQAAAGEQAIAQPWVTRKVTPNPHPPLWFALVGDCSGSMDAWREPMGVALWATIAAARKLGGGGAATIFANKVLPFITPKQPAATIPIPTLTGGSSGCPDALDAVVGVLRLPSKPGAKVAMVVTDSELPRPDLRHLTRSVPMLAARGVTVVWVNTTNNQWHPDGSTLINGVQPSDFPELVGRCCANAVTAASQHR